MNSENQSQQQQQAGPSTEMTSQQYSSPTNENMIRCIRNLLPNARTHNDYRMLKEKTSTAIRRISTNLQRSTTGLGEKKHLESILSRLYALKAQITRESLRLPVTVSGLGLTGNSAGRQQQYSSTPTTSGEFRVEWCEFESAFKSRIKTGVIVNHGHKYPAPFMQDAITVVRHRLLLSLNQRMSSIKVNFTFCGEFEHVHSGGEVIDTDHKYFSTGNTQFSRGDDDQQIVHKLSAMSEEILTKIDEFELTGSGWKLREVVNLVVAINKFSPFAGSSYIPLPEAMSRNPNILNIKNTDRRCFLWCLLASMYQANGDPEQSTSYPQNNYNLYNFQGIEFPVSLKAIPLFERRNANISVNVFGLDKKQNVIPLYNTNEIKPHHINLLLLTRGNGRSQNTHYCLIKDLGKLMYNTTFNRNNVQVCDRCLNHFHTNEKLELHKERCKNYRACVTKVPEPGSPESVVKFKNFIALMRLPFVIYADFECLTTKINNSNIHLTATNSYQKHVAYSCAYHLVSSYDESLSHFQSYRGPNPQVWLINQLRMQIDRIKKYLDPSNHLTMLPLTLDEVVNHDAAIECQVCKGSFTETNPKIHHHNHLNGKYVGAVCNECNIQIKVPNFVPVLFHNLSGYDAHLIIDTLTYDSEPIQVIPNTTENYISFSKIMENGIRLRFIDSFRFMPYSLEKLAQNLSISQFKHVKRAFPNPELFDLARRKGVFPYDFIDSWPKLELAQLPDKDAFYSQLTEEHISDEDYKHAQNVWGKFNISTLGDYSDLYMKIDVLLLADIFENFRDMCLKNYGLDAAAFYTAPGLAFAAALKITAVKLDLLTDIDMVLFIEDGIRGGITQACHRLAKANNKFLDSFDPNEPITYITYLDACNLYGWASVQSLPTNNFEWLQDTETIKNKLQNNHEIYDTDDKCCILEVDLEYPENIHDQHSDFPFCPQRRVPPTGRQKKLLTTLESKEKYILHLKNLQQALKHGLKLVKVHRVLQFSQSPWLMQYIMLNTELRKRATNEFEKNIFKLMNNANFGKNMENVRNYRKIKLVSSWEQARKLIARSEFKSATIFRENLVAVELWPTEIVFNKPLYVGMCILDLSKTLMYSFHYDYVRSQSVTDYFSSKICYMDTDSFVYKFTPTEFAKTQDFSIYDIIKRDAVDYFDTSGYSLDNVYGISQENEKVIGKMKDEMDGKIISDFIALRPKMYAYKVNGTEVKKLKGVGKSAVRRITFENYYHTLTENTQFFSTFNTIRSIKHTIYTQNVRKLALDAADNKRFILDNGVDTLPWGHYSIVNIQEV